MLFKLVEVDDYSLDIEGKHCNVRLYFVNEVKLYVIKALGKTFFANFSPKAFRTTRHPEKLPHKKEDTKVYQSGWEVFKSPALNKRVNWAEVTFNG